MSYPVRLRYGWNAFFLAVRPDQTPDELFADWPVERVGMYDQASYLRTKQFNTSASDSTQGAIENPVKYWVRGEDRVDSLIALRANAVYICKSTNEVDFTTEVYGEPEAMRISWHSSVGSTVNYVGLSTDGSAAVVRADGKGYFRGLDTGSQDFRFIYGDAPDVPGMFPISIKNPTVESWHALAVDSDKASDWSGAFFVSPMNGIDMGTKYNKSVMSIRNDSNTNRHVRVSMRTSAADGNGAALEMPVVLYFDPAGGAGWSTVGLQASAYERELVPGETLNLELAIDRTQLSGEAGTEFGGIIDVTDISESDPTHFKTSVPISITVSDSSTSETDWPNGLWVATLSLTAVPQFVAEGSVTEYMDQVVTNTYRQVVGGEENILEPVGNVEEKPEREEAEYETVYVIQTNKVPVYTTSAKDAGSTMKARIFIHRDSEGNLKLLQRVRIAGRRFSSAMLPVDLGVISGDGTFGETARFEFTVGEESRVNPFYHARHPDHDGLDADFKGRAPSGKEVFAIGNVIELDWAESGGAAWNPRETLSGEVAWSFTGLRREGAIKTEGTFTMRRISVGSLADVQEDF